MPLAIAVHGGAGNIPESLREEHRKGITSALEAGRAVLESGGTAIEAVIAAVVVLEDLPAFNAGYGSVLNAQGQVEMDAGLMDGRQLDIGAVAAVRGVKNPITLCKVVLESEHILFAREDAEALADRHGIARIASEELITPRRLKQWQGGDTDFKVDSGLASETVADTVGAVALDGNGNLAAATSTGGMSGKPVGRIGDSPMPGGGFYADNDYGACSTTGWGESIARILLARRAIEGLERGLTPQQAAEEAVHILGSRIPDGEGGLILIGRDGSIGSHFNSQRMTHAWWLEGQQQQVVA